MHEHNLFSFEVIFSYVFKLHAELEEKIYWFDRNARFILTHPRKRSLCIALKTFIIIVLFFNPKVK